MKQEQFKMKKINPNIIDKTDTSYIDESETDTT